MFDTILPAASAHAGFHSVASTIAPSGASV
ncbi:hypothetical protein MPHL21000_12965 [Mycolicibacterium phlei DSM 43239 = CCUG 21000]|uniref:Uncharacterized protein n=1 Tax=Mycolicibacterium phlei DSM 43239 = CCUG 21000 TaxID=1226750 RepID=A0A5N5V2D4_MYCPH|nr:hypothetical protein MPHL21000_12965 [Mycolicibacterium phlei DSM 43239 = CCUG 21000]